MGGASRICKVTSSWIDETFPGLAEAGYEITSEPTDTYNCIAYAAGDEENWWEFTSGYLWPGATRTQLIDGLVKVFESLGYEVCSDANEELGFHKVALFARGTTRGAIYTHAAKQLPGGAWSSKLGPDEDIRHENLKGLTGQAYGEVYCIMGRPDVINVNGENGTSEKDQEPAPHGITATDCHSSWNVKCGDSLVHWNHNAQA